MRRFLMMACVLAAMPAWAEDLPFATAKEIDLAVMLPLPSAAGSPADMKQRARVIAVQKAASPERIALADHDTDEDIFTMFAATLGPKFAAGNLPTATHFFARVGATEDAVVDPSKKVFGRQRPWVADPAEIPALTRKSSSGSYPSGHTTRVTMAAEILGSMIPEKRAAIWARAEEYAQSRVVGGMHYPEDLAGGRIAGSIIAGYFWGLPEFRAEYAVAKEEVRKALGM
jgi:acid phosphatase (class A)